MSVSLETLGRLLIESTQGYNPEMATRLDTMEEQPGYVTALVQLVGMKDLPSVTRTAAAIRLRKFITNRWTVYKNSKIPDYITPDDRKAVRAHLLPAIISETDSAIQSLLIACVYPVARQDYPIQWSMEATGPIMTVLNQEATALTNPTQLFGAIAALYNIMKVRRASVGNKKDREIIYETCNAVSTPLLSILYNVLQQHGPCIQHGDKNQISHVFSISHMAFKVISLQFQQVTLPYYKNSQHVNNVAQCLIQGAGSAQLDYLLNYYETHGQRVIQHPIIKSRKWAFRVLSRIQADALKWPDVHAKIAVMEQIKWNQAWHKGFDEPILETALNSLFQYTIPGHQITPLRGPNSTTEAVIQPNGRIYRPTMPLSLMRPMIRVFNAALKTKGAKAKLPFQTMVMSRISLFLRAFSSFYVLQDYDLETLDHNPNLFLQTLLNAGLVDATNDPIVSADDFLVSLFSRKASMYPTFVAELINYPLQQYQATMANAAQCTPQQIRYAVSCKDAAIRIFGITRIFGRVETLDKAFDLIQQLCQEHLAPSPETWGKYPILELRSLWCIRRFDDELQHAVMNRYQNEETKQPMYQDQCLQICLASAALCVKLLVPDTTELQNLVKMDGAWLALRVQAGSVLDRLLDLKPVRDAVLPFSSQLFASLLQMLEEHDNENISILFQRLLFHYQSQILPFTETILSRLITKFNELAEQCSEGQNVTFDEDGNPQINWDDFDDDDDDGGESQVYNAQAVLTSIHTVLTAIGDHPGTIATAEAMLLPLCHKCFQSQDTTFIIEILSLIQCLSYYSLENPNQDPSQSAWSLAGPMLHGIINGWALEYLDDFLPSLANFISYSTRLPPHLAHYTLVDFPEGKGVVTKTNINELILRFATTQFNSKNYTEEIFGYQEGAMHLLRSLVGWLPHQSQTSEQLAQHHFSTLAPQLIDQLVTSLAIVPHPDLVERRTEERKKAIAKSTDPLEQQKLSTTPLSFPQRTKYALLALDCLYELIYKYPSIAIPLLCSTPAPQAVQVRENDPQLTLMGFVLITSRDIFPGATRLQSLNYCLVGLATILQWMGSPGQNNDHQAASVLRSNIVTNMFSGMIRFRQLEEAEEDDDDEEEEDWFDDDKEDGEEEEDEELLAQKKQLQQENDLQAFARMAAAHTKSNSNRYFNDYDFASPIDHINFHELWLDSMKCWIGNSPAFSQKIETEVTLVNSLAAQKDEMYVENFGPIIDWVTESSQIFAKELAEEAEEEAAKKAQQLQQQAQQLPQ